MDHVPTVFIESPPPPTPAPPPQPRVDNSGGFVVSKGFLGMLIVLFLGAAIAGTGYFYMENNKALATVGDRDKAIADQKKLIADRDAAIVVKDKELAKRDEILKAHELQYGQIESLNAQAVKLQKDVEELLPRRPGTPGISDKIKAPLWRDAAVQQLTKYVADLQKEFNRIDRAAAAGTGSAPSTAPKQPNIQTTPASPT